MDAAILTTRMEKNPDLVDIWSRPGRWARQRAFIFLAINLSVYAALNVFVFWIQNARLLDFSWKSYVATYHKTLIDLLTFPIGVDEAPMMILIVGMLLGVIIIVPILISQLYGFRFSIVFTACVLTLAHLPVLSLFLLACSFIAGTSRRWLPFKFGVALLSVLPVVLYFYVATRGAPMLQLKPIDSTLLYAPWALAFLAAAGIAAAVLTFAKIVSYRPGGILISMIPFFAIPGVLFRYYIGADQLEFRLLAHNYGPDNEANLGPIDIRALVFQETLRRCQVAKVRDLETSYEIARSVFPYVAHKLLQQRRARVTAACLEFQQKYPSSRFIPNQLYIRGLAEDMRPDYTMLDDSWLQCHTELVSPASRNIWESLVEQFGKSIYSQPARLRLAIILTRQGKIKRARELLQQLITNTRKMSRLRQKSSTFPASFGELLTRPPNLEVPAVNLDQIHEQAQDLLELIEHNANDEKFGNDPLADLLKLDRHHPKWESNLFQLAVKYHQSKLCDNLYVMYALTENDPYKRKNYLQRYAQEFDGKDAGAMALFELANLMEAFARVNLDQEANDQAVELYHRLIDRYSDHSLTIRARARLAKLEGQRIHK